MAVAGAGVLLLGPPGSGKSDLALRLVDQPGSGIGGMIMTSLLLADDQVLVRRAGAELFASAPATIAGLLEIRGIGPVAVAHAGEVVLRLAVRLKPAAEIERLPPPQGIDILGVRLPLAEIDPAAASAPARLRAALGLLTQP